MHEILSFLFPVLLGAVALVLLLGVWTMMSGRGGNRSQILMRWRVILQLCAIVVLILLFYF